MAETLRAAFRVSLQASAPTASGGGVVRGDRLGQEWPSAFVHLLSTGQPARYGACGIGSGQFTGNHLRPLPRTGQAGSGQSLVRGDARLTSVRVRTPASAFSKAKNIGRGHPAIFWPQPKPGDATSFLKANRKTSHNGYEVCALSESTRNQPLSEQTDDAACEAFSWRQHGRNFPKENPLVFCRVARGVSRHVRSYLRHRVERRLGRNVFVEIRRLGWGFCTIVTDNFVLISNNLKQWLTRCS
jgi:hypothetical protein